MRIDSLSRIPLFDFAPAARLRALWANLVRPHESYVTLEQQRRARLLSVLSLILFVLGGLLLLQLNYQKPHVRADFDTIMADVVVLIMLPVYLLNRYGYLRLAAVLLIVSSGVTFVVGPFIDKQAAPYLLAYAVLSVIITGFFFNARMVFAVALTVVMAALGLSVVSPYVENNHYFVLQFLFLANMVILIQINHYNGIERDRRAELEDAYHQVRQSELLLEQRVQARTRDIEVAMAVSKQATTVLDLDELLPQIAERTRAAFGLYHVSVFLADASGSRLVLRAATGDEARQQQMLGHDLPVGVAHGPVARAASTRVAVVENDTASSAEHPVHPALPETRAELAVPMMVGDTLVGVLDLQANTAGRFEADDIRVLTSLAEQVAIAARNAGLYTTTLKARQEAEQSNRVKSQFLASMSHELRTPLNAILNFSQFIMTGMVGDVSDEQVDLLSKINGSGHHLLALINDVLDISKIESGALRLMVEHDVNLHEEMQPVIATAQSMLKEKPEVELRTAIAADLPLMVGDRRRIRQIMLNLVSNACKFTERGHVVLRVQAHGDEIIFAVEDTGPGIPPTDRDLIFETFRQSETGLRQGSGTGLGLPISRRLAEIHGGALWLESTIGAGSTFYVRLPVCADVLLESAPGR